MTNSIEGFSGAPGFKPVVGRTYTASEQQAATSAATEEPEQTADPARLSEATRQVEQLYQKVRRNLEFREDPSSGRVIVSVIDTESGEVIRQIPPEQMIRMAEHLEQMNGMLLGKRV